MKKIGIVICNFNKVDKVLECIQCILENKFTDYDLYVVDNASTDGAPDAIRDKYGDWIDCITIFEYNTTVFLYCSSGGKASESRS